MLQQVIVVLLICLGNVSSFSSYFRSYYTKSFTHSQQDYESTTLYSGIPDFSEDPSKYINLQSNQKILNPDYEENMVNELDVSRRLIEPNFEDMKEMAFILANITEHLDTKPELSLSVLSQKMGWLYSRDIPKLTQMLLQEFPGFRKDEGMMRSYMFLMDFLEAVVNETVTMQKTNQKALRLLLEAAQTSEAQVDQAITNNKEQLLKQEFLLYLDAEIESQEGNSSMENMLVTVKLRLLDEIGEVYLHVCIYIHVFMYMYVCYLVFYRFMYA
jgi:hypothetical protein